MGTFTEILVDELASLRDGETEMVEVLPTMWDASHQTGLAMLLRTFLRESRDQAILLGKMQASLGFPAVTKPWEGLRAAVEETVSQVFKTPESSVRDLILVSGLIRIKGMKIAGYNMARSLAENLDKGQTVELIVEMLVTEMEGELKLFEIARGLV